MWKHIRLKEIECKIQIWKIYELKGVIKKKHDLK